MWGEKLKTKNVCQGEIRNAYKGFQNKYLPRSLLDFKARLILGKTQFNNSLAHWVGENKSQNCIWCVRHGDYAPSDFIHTLYTYSTAQAVLQHIRKNLTNLKEITPVSVILTNDRCTKQVDNKGITQKKLLNPT